MRTRRQQRDTKDEANWRDLQAEQNGLLDPGQPTETATINHRKAMRVPFTAKERALIRNDLSLGR